nr:carboxylesterase family protein [Allosalinactinospora lopnorensis]
MQHTVRTSGGPVQRIPAAGGTTVFRGIPYAAPPLGELRFQGPRAAEPWKEVRDATGFGPIPAQGPALPGAPSWSPQDSGDILTLNVWAPEQQVAKRPVLVWIHGGAYLSGSSADPLYEAAELARAGLVAVSLNYRVGFEGFGHLPGCPDNRGLLDQVAALRWVRDNIAAFGGDPGNVTIAGQSAGAGSVVSLMTMPSAHGLFRRAIAHSVPGDFLSSEAAWENSERIAAAAGVPPTRDALSAVPPEELVTAAEKVIADFRGDPDSGIRYYSATPYAPVIDGHVLPGAPLHAIAAGATRDLDLLLCHTLHEWRLFTALDAAPAVNGERELAHAAAAFGLPTDGIEGYRSLDTAASVSDLYHSIAGDGLFTEYSTRIGEEHARAGGRAFLSRFAWESPALDGALRACHGLDLPFVFGTLDSTAGRLFLGGPSAEEQRELSRRMIRAWSDFAASGDPGWPAATPDTTPVKIWNIPDGLLADEDRTGSRALWRNADF